MEKINRYINNLDIMEVKNDEHYNPKTSNALIRSFKDICCSLNLTVTEEKQDNNTVIIGKNESLILKLTPLVNNSTMLILSPSDYKFNLEIILPEIKHNTNEAIGIFGAEEKTLHYKNKNFSHLKDIIKYSLEDNK